MGSTISSLIASVERGEASAADALFVALYFHQAVRGARLA
jgi:hypothetical protein